MNSPISFGGICEYGRACFYFEHENWNILLDAGIIKGQNLSEADQFPNIPKELIPKIQYIFISHSHEDHMGALPFLIKEGFNGIILSSAETKSQIFDDIKYNHVLKEAKWIVLKFSGNIGTYTIRRNNDQKPIHFLFGCSGHMIGALWLSIEYDGKYGFYSGDFSIDSIIYNYSLPTHHHYHWGIIDGAYPNKIPTQRENILNIKYLVKNGAYYGKKVLFPLPLSGRSLEICALLCEERENLDFESPFNLYADQNLIDILKKEVHNSAWFHSDGRSKILTLKKYLDNINIVNERDINNQYISDNRADFILISDSKMDSELSRNIYSSMDKNDLIIFTGNPGKNSFGKQLLDCVDHQDHTPRIIYQQYNVHLTKKQSIKISQKIKTKELIIFHQGSECDMISNIP